MKGGGKGARQEPVCLLIARLSRTAVTQSCGSKGMRRPPELEQPRRRARLLLPAKHIRCWRVKGIPRLVGRGRHSRAFAAPALRGPPPLTPARDCPPEPMRNRLLAASSDVGPSEPAHQVQCLAEQNSEAMNLSQVPNHPQLKNRPDSIRFHRFTRLL